MILSIDPGHISGYFLFTDNGEDTAVFGQVDEKGLFDFLTTLERPSLIIIEKFPLYGHKALQQTGSSMETPQIIGMVKMYAHQKDVPVVEQPASILPIAEMWSGVKVNGKGGHAQSHWKSAYNHGWYYLQKNGLKKSRILDESKP